MNADNLQTSLKEKQQEIDIMRIRLTDEIAAVQEKFDHAQDKLVKDWKLRDDLVKQLEKLNDTRQIKSLFDWARIKLQRLVIEFYSLLIEVLASYKNHFKYVSFNITFFINLRNI
jgi:hypothetical protein